MEHSYLYNALIISMILGIMISMIAFYMTRETPASFSELYYEDHTALPTRVTLYKPYNFSFVIHSLENTTTSYSYITKATLYNLYDITEGTYNCLARYREKIDLIWKNYTLLNTELFKKFIVYKDTPEIQPFRTVSQVSRREVITWHSYTINFKFRPILGSGVTTLYFTSIKGDPLYAIVMNYQLNTTYFMNFKTNSIELQEKSFRFTTLPTDIRVRVNNKNIEVAINDEQVFDAIADNTTNGILAIETRNTYIDVIQLRVFKDFAINPKEPETIKEYRIDRATIMKAREKFVEEMHGSPILEVSYNRANDPFSNIASWVDLPYKKHKYQYAMQLSSRNETNSVINWSNFELSFNYESYKPAQLAVGITNKFLFLIREDSNQSFLVSYLPGKVKVFRKQSKIVGNKHKVRLTMLNSTIEVFFDNQLFFNITGVSSDPGALFFDIRNQFAKVLSPSIKNLNCDVNSKCQKNYKILGKQQFPVTHKTQPKWEEKPKTAVSKPISETANNLLGVSFEKNDTYLFIPDSNFEFSGKNAVIENWSTYEFRFSYRIIDGLGVVGVVFNLSLIHI